MCNRGCLYIHGDGTIEGANEATREAVLQRLRPVRVRPQFHALQASANVCLTDSVPVLETDADGEFILGMRSFGYQLPTERPFGNARFDRLESSHLWRNAKPGILSFTGFYEWDAEKNPHLIRGSGHEVLALGAVLVDGCAVVVTTDPPEGFIHDRMPLVIEDIPKWLETRSIDAAIAIDWELTRVSKQVGNVREKGASVMAPYVPPKPQPTMADFF